MVEDFCLQAVFGLGNPGEAYAMTRHNLGFLVAEAFARDAGISLQHEKRFCARCGRSKYGEKFVGVCLPQTFMNLSGQAVSAYIQYFKIEPHNILVVVDDLDLEFGVMRLKANGSSGGHNGLKNIQSLLNTTAYPRLRIGIGRGMGLRQEDYVLGRFTQIEQTKLPTVIQAGVAVLKRLLYEPFSRVAQEVNRDDYIRNLIGIRQGEKEKEQEKA